MHAHPFVALSIMTVMCVYDNSSASIHAKVPIPSRLAKATALYSYK